MENYAHIKGGRLRKPSRLRSISIYVMLGIIFSLLGWLCETLFVLFVCNSFSDRGFPTLPLCPVYGFGLLAIFFAVKTPRSGIWVKIWSKPRTKIGRALAFIGCLILYALVVTLMSSLLEFATGLLFHKAFGLRMWNYDGYPLSIGGYVCLPYSAMWGFFGALVMTLVWEPIQTALNFSNDRVLEFIALALLSIIAADFIFNMVYLAAFGRHLNIFR